MRNINRMNDYFVCYLLGSIGNENILKYYVYKEIHNLKTINIQNFLKNINLKEYIFNTKNIIKKLMIISLWQFSEV